jgi:hypothetical protein
MTEDTLEQIRSLLGKAEERLKKAREEESWQRAASSREEESLPTLAEDTAYLQYLEAANEWIAYGQMTPGLLNELSTFVGECMRGLPAKPRPDVLRLVQSMQRIRAYLENWAESADFSPLAVDCTYPDLIKRALSARRTELTRWGIKSRLEDAAKQSQPCRDAHTLLRTILHVIQHCIEQMRISAGESKLFIRIQNAGERVETTFLCEIAEPAEEAPIDSEPPSGSISNNMHLRAAQRLLEGLGGSIVLENISRTQRAIRISLEMPA